MSNYFLGIYFFFFKYILLIMLLQLSLSFFLPFIPLCLVPPFPLAFSPPLSSCPWVVHISSLAYISKQGLLGQRANIFLCFKFLQPRMWFPDTPKVTSLPGSRGFHRFPLFSNYEFSNFPLGICLAFVIVKYV